MRRGNNSVMEGKVYEAAPSTAHTFSKPVRTPLGYHFETVSSNNELDCLLPLFAAKPRAYFHPALIDQVRAQIAAGAETVCYPQDSTSQPVGQQAV